MDSFQGHFLVASPHLPDQNFFRTVVLMIQHDENGAFGVVLNRPTNRTVKEVWQVIGENQCPSEDPIYRGGPVAGSLLAVHRNPLYSEREILSGLYLAAERNNLVGLVQHPETPYRIISGYSGWGGGQLENELRVGGWLTTPANADDVFLEESDLWREISRRIGKDMLSSAVNPDQLPDDPSMN